MINGKYLLRMLPIVVGLLMLTGCYSNGGGDFDSGAQWSNYKCYAVDAQNGQRYMGWSTDSGQARNVAIDKCRAHGSRNCQIAQCVHE